MCRTVWLTTQHPVSHPTHALPRNRTRAPSRRDEDPPGTVQENRGEPAGLGEGMNPPLPPSAQTPHPLWLSTHQSTASLLGSTFCPLPGSPGCSVVMLSPCGFTESHSWLSSPPPTPTQGHGGRRGIPCSVAHAGKESLRYPQTLPAPVFIFMSEFSDS